MTQHDNNAAVCKELRELLLLRHEPIAIKMMVNEEDVPAGAIHPKRDMGKHMALCQAFALARRDGKTLYMDKTSEWCWNPLIAFGLVECCPGSESFNLVCKFLGITDPDAAASFFADFPTLPHGKYAGILISPLSQCDVDPDVVLLYCNNAQLRQLVWAVKNITGHLIHTQLDAIDSCAYSCVVPMNTGEYRVTLPDVGEYERAAADENEIILSVPAGRMDELMTGMRSFTERGMGYTKLTRDLELDFSRPPFYNALFDMWGLDQGKTWSR